MPCPSPTPFSTRPATGRRVVGRAGRPTPPRPAHASAALPSPLLYWPAPETGDAPGKLGRKQNGARRRPRRGPTVIGGGARARSTGREVGPSGLSHDCAVIAAGNSTADRLGSRLAVDANVRARRTSHRRENEQGKLEFIPFRMTR